MAKEKNKGVSVQEGHIVVKNKKFKISDIITFLVCVLISLVIWIYATNMEKKEAPTPNTDNIAVETEDQQNTGTGA